MQMNELQKELDRTKVALMRTKDAAFFTTIVFSLKFEWDDTISTAATNGYFLKWNPTWFMSLPREERVGVMVHEANHVALDHMGRLGGRDMRLWNVAADHVINLMLLERGFKLPAFRLADPRFTGMSTEQVYNILSAENDQTPNPMDDLVLPGAGGSGNGSDSCTPPPTPQEHKKHIEDIIMRAAVQSRMQNERPGTIPTEVELFLDKLMRPKLPWQSILRREVGSTAKNGYTWSRPNKRYFPDYYLPARWSTAPEELHFYVDISGSVEDHQFTRFVSEIANALKVFNLKRVVIVQFDEVIHHVDVARNMRDLAKIKFHGRGGTCLECVFDHILENKVAKALIFTDGHFYWQRDKFKPSVTWLINDNPRFVPKFGKAIHFTTR